MSVRLGVLGCGDIARAAHLRSLAGVSGARVIALADTVPANLAAARPLAPDARAVAHYGDVLDMADVDAVIIALPPALHADAALAALQRGKHVYVEKPLATSVDDAARVLEASRLSGLTAMMGFNYRYNPLVRQARAAVASGAVGTPVSVRTVFTTPARVIPTWKQRRESGGGVLLDLAVHHIDLIRFLFDTEIAHVSADVRSSQSEHDTALLQLGLTNGAMAQVMCSLGSIDDDRIEIHGSAGRVTVDRYRSLRVEVTPANASSMLGVAAARFAGEMRALPYALRKLRSPMHDPSFPAAMSAFVRAVAERTPVTPNLEDGLRALVVVDAAEQSARAGRVITLRPPAPPPSRAAMPVQVTNPSPVPSVSPTRPALSVVLITPDSFETIRRTVGCLALQTVHDRIELVIVAPEAAVIDIDETLVAALAGVRVVRMASLTPTGPGRAAGIRGASAPIVAFGEEHCFPSTTWAEALLVAHREDVAAVGPAMHNANPDSIVSWADFLIGYGPWAAPVVRHEPDFLPGHNSSYKRAVLVEYGDALDTLMEAETVLMWDLRGKGHRLLLEPAAQTSHTNFGLWSSWLPVMFLNGRAFADTRAAGWPLARRLAFVAASPMIPLVRLKRMLGHARRLGRGAPFLARVIPTLTIGLVLDGIGQLAGYALGAGDAHSKLAAYEWHRMKHTGRGDATSS